MSDKKWEFFLPPGKFFSPTKLVSIEDNNLVIEDPPNKKIKEEVKKIEITKLNKMMIEKKLDKTNTIYVVCSLLVAVLPFIPKALVVGICLGTCIIGFLIHVQEEYKFSISTDEETLNLIDRPIHKYSTASIHLGLLKTALSKIKLETPDKCHIEIEENDIVFKKQRKLFLLIQLGILILGLILPHSLERVGSYELTELDAGYEKFDESYMKEFKKRLGYSAGTLVLNEDKTGVLTFLGETMNINWDDDDFWGGGITFPYTYKSGVITFENALGQILTFTKR